MVLHCLTSIAAHSKSKWECSRGNHKNLSLVDFICKGFRVIMEDRMNNKMYPISKIVLLFYDLQLLCCYYCLVTKCIWIVAFEITGQIFCWYLGDIIWHQDCVAFNLPMLSEPWCQLFIKSIDRERKTAKSSCPITCHICFCHKHV